MIENINARLRELIPPRDETIFEAARYALLAPGKRLRPLLTLATAATLGADPLLALDPACAVEMIHTYSLIHDDLPCMDDDDMRRGQPTLHKVYSEALALLAGDYLLTFAFEVLSNAPHLTPHQQLLMIRALSTRAGAPGMIGGQVIDIESQGCDIDEETLLQMHVGKTASLISAALELGRIASGVDCPLLDSIGHDLGLAYQLQDDLLDATSTTSLLGKTAGSDAAHHKATAITLYGPTALLEKLRSLERSLFHNLQQLPNQGGKLAALVAKILQRKS
ncbi:MAG TPA: farnesyl diphosphate synthase [Chlamydiales bacterium]|nr:farnesyl diphosphate synthase [Chlamydiales bacterium]